MSQKRNFYLFSGEAGEDLTQITYGNHAVWQMWQPGREPVNGPLMPWYEAIDQPGAGRARFTSTRDEAGSYAMI